MVLRAYLLGVVPYSLIKILAPAFYALDRPRIPVMASFASVAVNLGFNGLTYRVLGAPGLALGTTLGAVTNFLVLYVAFRSRVGDFALEKAKISAASLFFANVALAVLVCGIWFGLGCSALPNGAARTLALLVTISCGGGAFFFALLKTGHPLGSDIYRALQKQGERLKAKLARRR